MQNFGICVLFWNEIAHFYENLHFSVSIYEVYLRNRKR